VFFIVRLILHPQDFCAPLTKPDLRVINAFPHEHKHSYIVSLCLFGARVITVMPLTVIPEISKKLAMLLSFDCMVRFDPRQGHPSFVLDAVGL